MVDEEKIQWWIIIGLVLLIIAISAGGGYLAAGVLIVPATTVPAANENSLPLNLAGDFLLISQGGMHVPESWQRGAWITLGSLPNADPVPNLHIVVQNGKPYFLIVNMMNDESIAALTGTAEEIDRQLLESVRMYVAEWNGTMIRGSFLISGEVTGRVFYYDAFETLCWYEIAYSQQPDADYTQCIGT